MKKSFDCVKMKNDIQEKLYKSLGANSAEDFIDKLTEKSKGSGLILKKKTTR